MSSAPISAVGQAMHSGAMAAGQPAPALEALPAVSPAATPPPVQGTREPSPQPDAETVKQAAERINAFIRSTQRNLEISVDKDTGIVVVKVVDKESGEVIRQIPAEEVLAIAKSLDSAQGVLFRSKV